jgi:hypothetical protein
MCGSSYAWTPDVAYFDGEEWINGGVLAWREIPFDPFYPVNDEERTLVFKNEGMKKPTANGQPVCEYTTVVTGELPF